METTIKNIVADVLTTIAEGFTSAIVVTQLTNTERVIILNIIGAMALRIIWYYTERKIISLRHYFHAKNYQPSQPSDQARNAARDWRNLK